MRSFEEDLRRHERRVRQRWDGIHRGVAAEVFKSVVEGSPITGAPGQPVKYEDLKKSWKRVSPSRLITNIITDSPYAEIIENNRRGARLRSKVGGFHSVKMTRAGFQGIVRYVNRRLKYAGQDTMPGSVNVNL